MKKRGFATLTIVLIILGTLAGGFAISKVAPDQDVLLAPALKYAFGGGGGTCTFSRVCVDEDTYKTTDTRCKSRWVDCAAGEFCQSGTCIANETATYSICSGNSCIIVKGTGRNQCSSSADCQPQLPDLIVESIIAYNSTDSQTSYTISANIKNIGDAASSEFNASLLIWSPSTGFVLRTENINPLSPGQTAYGRFSQQPFIFAPGDFVNVDVNADSTNKVVESNEFNNNKSIFFSVPAGNETQLPDLIVEDIIVNSIANSSGGNNGTSIGAYIKNIGDATASGSSTLFTIYTSSGSFARTDQSSQTISPGDRLWFSTSEMSLIPGTYTANVSADYTNNVVESNENNNIGSIIFTV